MIQFQSVHKAYRVAGREIPALQPTTLQVGSGQVFGIIGHSGAGKSTLLRLINRLEEPSGGRIEIDGVDVTALDANGLRRFRQQVGMIFQHFNLLSSKTVADNIAMPLRLAGETRDQHAGDVEHGPGPCPGGAHGNGALKADGSAHETEDHERSVVGGEGGARGGGQPQ